MLAGAVRGTPEGLRRSPGSPEWILAADSSRARNWRRQNPPKGPDDIRAHSGRENPIVRGRWSLHTFQRLTLAGIAPLARPPQSCLRRGVASDEAGMPAPLLRRALAGRLAGALRTALRRNGGLVRGRVHGDPCPLLPEGSSRPQLDRSRGASRSGDGGSFLTRAELRERSGDTDREVALPEQPGRSRAEWGRKPAPGLQSWRFRVHRAQQTVPCGAVRRADSCEPAADA